MEIEIEIAEARRCWPDLLRQAAGGVRVVLLCDGEPIGALVGAEDYEQVLLHRASRGETGPPN
jgi:antitoxin (DNA-binding transcriptional repressor) of toxin-antitoxin stability system